MAEFIMIDTLWTSNEAQLDLIIVWTIHAKPIFFPEKNHSACIDSSNRLPFLFLKKKKSFEAPTVIPCVSTDSMWEIFQQHE